jgi:hypothetical protein
MSLDLIARKINESFASECEMAVGKIMKHPSGRKVKITRGQFLRNGRVSNFWHWKEVLKNGELGEEECGYGW